MVGEISVVRYCKVISIDDANDADRIKVRLIPEDNSKSIDQIDYAFPMLPKNLHVKPKIGEGVLVFLAITNDGNSQRYYIGPIISQDHRIYNDPFFMGGDSFLRGSYKGFDIAPRMDPEQRGILPNDTDVVLRGRKNADIQITDDDVRIKAGVKLVKEDDKYKMAFNPRNPAYAKFKYHTKQVGDAQSTASIVADKILLMSTSSPEAFELTDREDLITDKEIEKIITTAFKLPYGEKLIEFLKIFVNAFTTHTHDFPMLPPNPAHTTSLLSSKLDMLDNERMLSDSIRIN